MNAPITGIYAALMAFTIVGMALRVARMRMKKRIGIGDGGDKQLHCFIRAHGNLTEYAPVFLVLLLIVELNGTPAWLLHIFGGVFVLARWTHLIGLSGSGGYSQARFLGSAISWTMINFTGILALLYGLGVNFF